MSECRVYTSTTWEPEGAGRASGLLGCSVLRGAVCPGALQSVTEKSVLLPGTKDGDGMKTAWVTGAGGFIGRHLSRHLALRGIRVIGTDLVSPPVWGTDPETTPLWVRGELSERALEEMAEVADPPECVFHLAGGSAVGASLHDPLTDFSRTTALTMILLDWVRRRCPQARVVLASSAAVYGDGYAGPIRVDAAPRPLSPYGFHKRMAEQACESYARNFGVASTVVRLFSVFGPGLRKQLLWDVCGKLASNPTRLDLGGTGREVRDWIPVEAAVLLLEQAGSDRELHRVRNGGTGRGMSVAEVVELLLHAWGSEAAIVFNGSVRQGDPEYLVAANEEGQATASTLDFPGGIRQYVKWFRGGAKEWP